MNARFMGYPYDATNKLQLRKNDEKLALSLVS